MIPALAAVALGLVIGLAINHAITRHDDHQRSIDAYPDARRHARSRK